MTDSQSKPQPILSIDKPWDTNDNSIWLASTLKLCRNVEKFSFPTKLADAKKRQLISLVSRELLASQFLSNPFLIHGDQATPTDKEFLLEHFLITQSFHQTGGSEAFVLDDTGKFLALLNIHDHIQLQLTDTSGQLEEAWNRLMNVETELGSAVNYAFSPTFGFLTADPTQCGTGLVVQAFLHLPALIHTHAVQDIIVKHSLEGVAITGMQGDAKNLIGDVVAVHNTHTLGLTEENIISNLRLSLMRLTVEEKSARAKIRDSNDPGIKDLISRAFGLLRHSYQVETIEALNAISLIKLGCELGWVSGISLAKLNQLFIHCRRAHLMALTHQEMGRDELLHHRAKLVHETIQGATLKTE